jgi:hypothetical protein
VLFRSALLAPTGQWDRARINAVIATGETRTVALAGPIPVYIAYFTAEPDDDGTITFFPDIYKGIERQSRRTAGGPAACNAPVSAFSKMPSPQNTPSEGLFWSRIRFCGNEGRSFQRVGFMQIMPKLTIARTA